MPTDQKVAGGYVDLELRLQGWKQSIDEATAETRKLKAEVRANMKEAQGSIALLGEEVGVHLPRHLRTFVAGLPGVATAMSAAFNAVAIFALANIVIETGKKIYEFAEKSEAAARKHADAWKAVGQPMRATNDDLAVTNDKLDQSIAKLEHKPFNGMKLAIDEAVQSAGKLGDKLTEDAKKLSDYFQANEIGMLGRLQGKAQTGDVTEHARDLQTNLEKIQTNSSTFDYSGMTESAIAAKRKEFADAYQDAINEEKTWAKTQLDIANGLQARHDAQGGMAFGVGNVAINDAVRIGGTQNQSKRIESLTDFQSGVSRMGVFNTLSEANSIKTGQVALDEAKQTSIEAAKKASADLLKTFETAYQQQNALSKMTLSQESSFWNSKLASFTKGSSEYLSVVTKFAGANNSEQKFLATSLKDYRERTGPVPQLLPSDRGTDTDNSAIAKGLEQQAEMKAALTEVTTKYKLETGAISEHDAALLMTAAHTDEYKAKITTLTDELAKLRGEEMDYNGKNVDPENAAKQQSVQNQIDELSGKAKVQALTDAQATLGTTWSGMVDSVFDSLIKKSRETTDQLRQIASTIIDGINGELAKSLTGQKTDYRKVLLSGSEQLAKTGVQKLEGMGLSALGFGGGKRDGSSAQTALFVQMAGGGGATVSGGLIPGLSGLFPPNHPNVTGPGGAGMASSASKGLLGFLNNSNWASSLMGGKLFGAGSMFGGGFALGGAVDAGIPIDVGEMGKERFTPSVPGHITPHNQLGGGITYNIDAHGTDPALSKANFERALQHTHQQSVSDATRAMAEHSRRQAH